MTKIKKDLEEKLRRQAKNRCGYCLNPQEFLPYKLEIEAVDNLTGKIVKLFNPRRQIWSEHFEFSKDKTEIIGKTACGRATVESLQMNNFYQTTARSIWVEMNKYPPKDD